MIVALADEELDRFAGRLHRSGEIASLPLKFRGLVGAMRDDKRRMQAVEMPPRAQLSTIASVKLT